ncbi:alanine--tRNA ligase [Striga asiatica]|uniref:Alanine--tRNA ligase n=1 Tax=Striga asiatica TaxID=4170 RepID=A0A5A7Q1L2_STRAF|nr:alanine--tRNA ligase [Striga asiatica]
MQMLLLSRWMKGHPPSSRDTTSELASNNSELEQELGGLKAEVASLEAELAASESSLADIVRVANGSKDQSWWLFETTECVIEATASVSRDITETKGMHQSLVNLSKSVLSEGAAVSFESFQYSEFASYYSRAT